MYISAGNPKSHFSKPDPFYNPRQGRRTERGCLVELKNDGQWESSILESVSRMTQTTKYVINSKNDAVRVQIGSHVLALDTEEKMLPEISQSSLLQKPTFVFK